MYISIHQHYYRGNFQSQRRYTHTHTHTHTHTAAFGDGDHGPQDRKGPRVPDQEAQRAEGQHQGTRG